MQIYDVIKNPSVLIIDESLKKEKKFLVYSFIFSALAIFNWRLGSAVITEKGFNFFLLDFLFYLFFFLGLQIFYLPVIHFFAEQPDTKLKPFIAYFNFSTKILHILLPISIVLFLIVGGLVSVLIFYGLSLSFIVYLYFCTLKGLKINYRVSSVSAIFFTTLPSVLFSLLLLIESALILGIVFYSR